MPPAALRDRIGYAFKRPELLSQALTHRSYGSAHNERLEFVGDAVLDCVIAMLLYRRFAQMPEGDLSRVRANLVNRDMLARLAVTLGVGSELKLGEGEQRSGGATRPSILADALEAIFGAVFVDGGFDAASAVIEAVYADDLAQLDPAVFGKDPKTRLQEWLQARRIALPDYEVTEVAGEAHAQTFTVSCTIAVLGIVTAGIGGSRRAAEQDAARKAYAEAVATEG
jgi:ribonuclease-3